MVDADSWCRWNVLEVVGGIINITGGWSCLDSKQGNRHVVGTTLVKEAKQNGKLWQERKPLSRSRKIVPFFSDYRSAYRASTIDCKMTVVPFALSFDTTTLWQVLLCVVAPIDYNIRNRFRIGTYFARKTMQSMKGSGRRNNGEQSSSAPLWQQCADLFTGSRFTNSNVWTKPFRQFASVTPAFIICHVALLSVLESSYGLFLWA